MAGEQTNRNDLFKSPEFLSIIEKLEAFKATLKDKKSLKKRYDEYQTLINEAQLKIQEIAKIYLDTAFVPVGTESPFEEDVYIHSYDKALEYFRDMGLYRITHLITENRDVKINKQIDSDVKKATIKQNKEEIVKAKFSRYFYKPIVKELVKQSIAYSELVGRQYFNLIKSEQAVKVAEAKLHYDSQKAELISEHRDHLQNMTPPDSKASKEEKDNYRSEVKAAHTLNKVRLNEAKNIKKEKLNNAKNDRFNAFIELYGFQNKVRGNRSSIKEKIEYRYRTYLYNFELKDYLLRNALYFIVLIYFGATIVMSGGSLLSWNNVVAIAGQTSTKLFFSLGVAGLILITGTDLSIGRMTGMTAITASIVMSGQVFQTNQGWVLDFTGLPDMAKVGVALILAIILAVIFSAIAGFFTAKFKMHPFITTLSTQLLIFGLMMIMFSSVPSFRIDSGLKSMLAGTRNSNIIIAAVVAVAVLWFIWNKTKFGKNMYAVGGNAEAAAVSGINVFAVTMGIFVMAGIFYGIGGFFEAIRVGTAQPNTGAGTELDAIAACVVGGISFSGGIGKIRGAVIGTIIFTGITYTLTYLGYDPNIQFIFKGIIIMAAVCLDSLKYLRKK